MCGRMVTLRCLGYREVKWLGNRPRPNEGVLSQLFFKYEKGSQKYDSSNFDLGPSHPTPLQSRFPTEKSWNSSGESAAENRL